MEQRYATNPTQIPRMTTDELRAQYLVPELFVPGAVTVVYTHHDRIVLGGAVPAGTDLTLTGYPEIRSDHFLEHREVGIVNVGGTGTVTADGGVFASPTVDVVDAVGAGDAFAGGYLAAVLDDVDLHDRLRAGHDRAALTLRTTGDSIDEEVLR